MTNRALLLCLIAVAARSVAGFAQDPAPVVRDTSALPGPRQPIFFRHDVHTGQYQIPCLYCHSLVTVSSEPGIPAWQTCVGCHLVVPGGTRGGVAGDTAAAGAEQAEIRRVMDAWIARTPPEWIRVHTVPGFVRFPHMRHVKALGEDAPSGGAYTCTLCHGDVQRMPQVYRVESLKMGWCLRCHVQRKASRDCTVCHY